MKSKFDIWKEDAVTVHMNEVWDALIEPSDSDAMTTELLQLLCGTFATTTQRTSH